MTKETWTPTEEAAFVALQERRERVQAAMKAGVTTLVDRHFTGMPAEAKDAMFSILTKHADDWRDALAPFDSGVRAAVPAVPECAPPGGWAMHHLPLDHRLGVPWPVSYRPDAGRRISAFLRGGKHLGPADVDSFAWGVTGDTSDVVSWRYAD